jgi:ribonuclease BN (tRNA processing enzyme)
MRLARIAEPRCLVLTHLYPEWDGVDLETKAAELWAGKTVGAYDGLRLEVGTEATLSEPPAVPGG